MSTDKPVSKDSEEVEFNAFQLVFPAAISNRKTKDWKLACRRTSIPGKKKNDEIVLEAVLYSCLEFTELEFLLEVFSGVF